ncbi:2-oxoacid:ferredoxin oxidoreductase subunit beta [Candidatus Roizmanbacteria bacterium]|nr:2-oxoacid:ferredoxin oxidoreductase subunit beta [Candidatus Roizmanbacteria bacterium]
MATIEDFSGYAPTWCPGCGDWGIGVAIKSALVQLGLDPSSVMAIFGIGCSGNMNDFLNAYGLHALHGRGLPNAIGAKLANHALPVIAIVGDGDCYGEGGNHLLHACRGNHDLTVIVHDNGVYGLTTGQVSPTAQKGFKSKSTPSGIIEKPINPLTLALASGATFVAQGFAGDINFTIPLIKKAIEHRGFSLVNILQPCVTFNHVNTYQYYLQRVYKLNGDYRADSLHVAMPAALQMNEEKFPLGVIYQVQRPTYVDQVAQLKGTTLLNKKRFEDLAAISAEFI